METGNKNSIEKVHTHTHTLMVQQEIKMFSYIFKEFIV